MNVDLTPLTSEAKNGEQEQGGKKATLIYPQPHRVIAVEIIVVKNE
jgi:hypothetical protein